MLRMERDLTSWKIQSKTSLFPAKALRSSKRFTCIFLVVQFLFISPSFLVTNNEILICVEGFQQASQGKISKSLNSTLKLDTITKRIDIIVLFDIKAGLIIKLSKYEHSRNFASVNSTFWRICKKGTCEGTELVLNRESFPSKMSYKF
jgi:hypothetical protein